MSGRRKAGKRWKAGMTEPHVRLYKHELECPAYLTLSPAARALLVELRSLFSMKSGNNHVYCGFRRIMDRCKMSQRIAARAREELIEKGWITIVQVGGFQQKVRHATVFALENEPPNTTIGTSVPNKAYMRWQPSQNQPVAITAKKVGSGRGYKPVADVNTVERLKHRKFAATVSTSATDERSPEPSTVANVDTQIGLPGGRRSGSAVPALDPAPAPAVAAGAKRRKSP